MPHSPRRSRRDDDTGASLVLALVLIVVSSVMTVSLLGWATNDLNNVATFKAAQSEQAALTTAAEAALAQIRYNFEPQTISASPPASCWVVPSGATGYPASQVTSVIDATTFAVDTWCSTSWSPLSSKTRTVTISACRATTDAPTCAHHPELQVDVVLNDYPAPVSAISGDTCSTTCGTGMVVAGWTFDVVTPTVTSFTPSTGPTGTTITVTGTGFTTGSTLQFVSTNFAGNVVLSATSVTVVSHTSLTARVPAVSSGSSYYVTVATPSGSSAYGSLFTG
jgi:hypothetical protein